MKLGQFCGLVADVMDLRHSEFLAEAETMFALMENEESNEEASEISIWGEPLPDRTVTITDAAMTCFLVVAVEFYGYGEHSGFTSSRAREMALIGENLPSLLKAIRTGQSVSLDLSCRLETLTSLPQKLIETMNRVVGSAKPVRLKTV